MLTSLSRGSAVGVRARLGRACLLIPCDVVLRIWWQSHACSNAWQKGHIFFMLWEYQYNNVYPIDSLSLCIFPCRLVSLCYYIFICSLFSWQQIKIEFFQSLCRIKLMKHCLRSFSLKLWARFCSHWHWYKPGGTLVCLGFHLQTEKIRVMLALVVPRMTLKGCSVCYWSTFTGWCGWMHNESAFALTSMASLALSCLGTQRTQSNYN